ncbi:MAG: hypothetical protein SGARI_001186, partial [Bacillariaceae sp.]
SVHSSLSDRPHKKARKEICRFSITKKAPILALIEGIVRPQNNNQGSSQDSGSTNASTSMEDYRQKVAQRDWPEEDFPRNGVPQELPSICLRGKWQAEWHVEEEADRTADASGKKDVLSGYRLCLRHTDRVGMGLLPPTVADQNGLGESYFSNITVSCLFPSKKRSPKLSRSKSDKGNDKGGRQEPFIATICMVGCDGFDSSSEGFLNPVFPEDSDSEDDDNGSVGKGESSPLLIHPVNKAGACVGVAVQSVLPLDSKYHVRFAQDLRLENNPIVAVDAQRTENAQNVGYVNQVDTLRKDRAQWRGSYQSHAKQQGVESSKKQKGAAAAAPLKGHREKVPQDRYAPPNSSSDEEDDHCNGTGNQDLSPASKDSWATHPKLPASIVPRQTDHLSAPRPKSLEHKFDEEASRDSREAEQVALKMTKASSTNKKVVKAKVPPSKIFHNKGKRKPKRALPATKSSRRPRKLPSKVKVKKELAPRRLPLNSPFGKGKKKPTANRVSRIIPSSLPVKSKSNSTRTLDTLGSWSDDDWGGNSVNGSDVGGDQNHDFDAKSPVVHQTQPESDNDEGTLLSEDDSINRQGRGTFVKAPASKKRKNTGEYVSFDDRLSHLPRNAAPSKKRWWLLAFGVFLALGGGLKETVPRHATIMGLMRQKKNSLPSPVRLTGKNPESFSFPATTW